MANAQLILVHGAWHGAWCWERVLAPLAARGIPAHTLDLPSIDRGGSRAGRRAGLSQDAAAVRELIDRTPGELIVCGHSYGGMVISHAASGSTRVKRLIYLCAFMPEPGQSLVAIGGNAPWVKIDEDGMTLPDPALAAELFYGDCDPATQAWAVAQLRPQPSDAFIEAVPAPAWRDIPASYIVCSQDAALPAQLQRSLFAPRARDVHELEASHSPFLSQPTMLAELLASIAALQ